MPVISQAPIKTLLRRMFLTQRVPHALLFTGGEGRGKLAMAWQFARTLLCQHPTAEGKPCNACPACLMSAKAAHPDLHFVMPVVKQGASAAVSDAYLTAWRQLLTTSPYFTRDQWLQAMGTENQQALIAVAEADALQRKLSLASSQGGYRPVIVWQAEAMNVEAANKLLKLLEEPPAGTVFILTSSHPERLLDTIRSRTQPIDFPPIAEADMVAALMKDCALSEEDATVVARASEGSYTRALEQVTANGDTALFLDLFIMLMRLAYLRKVKDLAAWSEQMAKWGRERQKSFLTYCLRMVRENFMYNFHRPAELNALTASEADFSSRFARFVNERNVLALNEEFALALLHVERNVNAKMVFFDLALKVIMLVKG